MFIYAQIEGGKCVALLQTNREVDAPNMVSIASYDMAYLGRTYADGQWT